MLTSRDCDSFHKRFMEEALQRHNLLYTGDAGKKRNPDTGLLEGFVAVYQDDLVWWDDDREVRLTPADS
eukprot:COSAG02_NODE_18780_length_919_cov_2.112195_1_plen_69_part_00